MRSFPAGSSAPTDVIVPDAARVPAVAAALQGAVGVSAVRPVDAGPPGARLAATLVPTPTPREAFDLVPRLRDAVKAAGGRTRSSAGRPRSTTTCAWRPSAT